MERDLSELEAEGSVKKVRIFLHEAHRCTLYKKTYGKDLEVLDLLMVAQGEHERPGITLAVPQQE